VTPKGDVGQLVRVGENTASCSTWNAIENGPAGSSLPGFFVAVIGHDIRIVVGGCSHRGDVFRGLPGLTGCCRYWRIAGRSVDRQA
jgi:hypothetical protein